MRFRRAVIVSESALLCSALEKSLQSDFAVVVKLTNIEKISVDETWSETILVVDVSHLGQTVEALTALRQKGDLGRTVLLTRANQGYEEFVPLLCELGAILPNMCTMDDVSQVTRALREGLVVVPSQMLREIQKAMRGVAPLIAKNAELTDREHGVLALLAKGCSNKVIARRLNISDSTVRVHVRSVLKKLGLQNRTQAALIAAGARHQTDQPASYN